ncbi:hypothetical protein MS6207_00801 [Escherichia coli]|nr:hypothetical protein [Escherichia coli]NUV16628.1 hypothetical protein [Escherichia coli]NUV24177.1 hypothetical protein [Escherichia coli]OKL94247.1 phage small terminase subunit [Escherichia coli]QKN71942.1 Phage terminase, small subunit [Escherichia coli]
MLTLWRSLQMASLCLFLIQGNTITGAMGGRVKNPELTAKKEQESEMSSTGAMLGLDPSSRQRLIGLAGQKKATNPFLKIIES